MSPHARFFHRTILVTLEIHLFINANLILRYATHTCHSNMAQAFLHAARWQNANSHLGLLANCDLGLRYDPHTDRKATPSKQIAFLLDETSRLIACCMRFDHATKISSHSPRSLYSCLVAACTLGFGLASESDASEELDDEELLTLFTSEEIIGGSDNDSSGMACALKLNFCHSCGGLCLRKRSTCTDNSWSGLCAPRCWAVSGRQPARTFERMVLWSFN